MHSLPYLGKAQSQEGMESEELISKDSAVEIIRLSLPFRLFCIASEFALSLFCTGHTLNFDSRRFISHCT